MKVLKPLNNFPFIKADAEKLLLTDLSEEEFIETQKKLFRAVARLENLNNN